MCPIKPKGVGLLTEEESRKVAYVVEREARYYQTDSYYFSVRRSGIGDFRVSVSMHKCEYFRPISEWRFNFKVAKIVHEILRDKSICQPGYYRSRLWTERRG